MSVASNLLEKLQVTESKADAKRVLDTFLKAGFEKSGDDSEYTLLKSPNGTEVKVGKDCFSGDVQNSSGKPSRKANFFAVYSGGSKYGDVTISNVNDIAARLAKQ